MIPVKIIESPDFNSVINNIQEYCDLFIKDEVYVLRNANFTFEQQQKFMEKMGDVFGWSPNSKNNEHKPYHENHERLGEVQKTDKDKIVVPWHIEHSEYNVPTVAATWNMHIFDQDPSLGKTVFVNTKHVFNALSDDEKEFLIKSYEKVIIDDEHIIKACREHPYTKEQIIRMDIGHIKTYELHIFDDREPTKEEKIQYSDIKWKVINQIIDEKKNWLFHEWQQGDFLVVDLFKMAHAVCGGFDPQKRSFSGDWAWEIEPNDI